MTTSRRGLGRGLGALIPTGPGQGGRTDGADSPVSTFLLRGPTDATHAPALAGETAATQAGRSGEVGAGGSGSAEQTETEGAQVAAQSAAGVGYFAELPLEQIVPNPRQPRQVFEDESLDELVRSIREIGLLQPVVVRPVDGGRFELVMGERRWRASQRAGKDTIPAIVRQTSDDDMLRDALLENLHRAQLNPLEEAAAYGQLLDDFGCTHDELAARIGRSRPQISNTLRLLKLPPAVQRRVAAGVLSAGHARALLAAPDAETADRLAHRVVAEGISVRALEEIVAVGEPGAEHKAGRRARTRTAPAGMAELSERLSEHFDTRVTVDVGRNRGRIMIEFGSAEDLERIVAMMDRRQSEGLD